MSASNIEEELLGKEDEQNIEDVVSQLVGELSSPTRLDGPYEASIFEANGSIQTTVAKRAWKRTEVDIESLGKRDQYLAAEHGLLIIDLQGDFRNAE